MKIFIACSKHFYNRVGEIKKELEVQGHEITLPNSYEEPFKEEEMKKLSKEYHMKFKQEMMKLHEPKIKINDAILVLNLEKDNKQNYIGGGTFMEIVKAWELGKKIFLFNPIPNSLFEDELTGINPIILDGDLSKMQTKKIEVEIRSFITKEQYEKLLEFFRQNAEFVKEDFQETHYFDCEEDLRIQKNNSGAKIWLKKGKIHDDAREEIEIKTNHEDFEKSKKIFNSIGLGTEIKWLRDRKQFNWNGIKVCLDYTKGYGYIIELEKMGSEYEKEELLEGLKQKLNQLGITQSSKEEFNEKFNHYKENWRNLIKDDMD